MSKKVRFRVADFNSIEDCQNKHLQSKTHGAFKYKIDASHKMSERMRTAKFRKSLEIAI